CAVAVAGQPRPLGEVSGKVPGEGDVLLEWLGGAVGPELLVDLGLDEVERGEIGVGRGAVRNPPHRQPFGELRHGDTVWEMGISATVELIEYTDPGCSWAWGTEPKLRLLRWRYEDRVSWRRVMGGLVEDMTRGRGDWDPERAAPRTIEYWKVVTGHTGMPYPARLRYVG